MNTLQENLIKATPLRKMNFTIQGMTCESCVKTITARILALPEVTTAEISLKDKTATITAKKDITLYDVRNTLIDLPKYTVLQNAPVEKAVESSKPNKTWLQTYKPLITVFAFVFLVSGAYQVSLNQFHMHLFMNHIMAGFFIGLSFFKFLDLKSFAESFSNYDPIAKRFLNYGYIYAFVEVILGLLFISGLWLAQAQAVTAILLTTTTIGVVKRLQSKSPFECACLGTSFSLPLSNVTVAENTAMIAMAIYGLIA
jgi:copper chaperone CopZ